MCYNKVTKEMRNPVSADSKSWGRAGRVPQKKEKNLKKTLDKLKNMCYNKGTKGKEKEINKMYFFQLVTLEPTHGSHKYYYFMSTGARCPRSLKLDNNYPDKLRLLIEDREEAPFTLECIDYFTYFYRKYIKQRGRFSFGERVNWEKEEL